jgi:hypothetical protein
MSTDPWELLRQARNELDVLASYVENPNTVWPTAGLKVTAKAQKKLRDRIEVALAERQDSATDVVEWRLGDDCDEEFVYYEAYPDSDTGLDVVRFKDGRWRWTMSREQQGYCDTLAEARRAATAAARGVR